MRRMVTTGAVLIALVTISACQSDSAPEKPANGGSNASGLPSAGTMAEIEGFVSKHTTCTDLELDPEDPEEESVGPAWGIKERALCFDAKKMAIRLLAIDNMKQFQTKTKETTRRGYLIGKDFAVRSKTSVTREAFKGSGLLYFTCDPDIAVPSGYKKEKPLVDGCTLTDYIP